MKKIIINDEPWQTRIALVENQRLQNIYFDTHATERLERSYFKGNIQKVLPGIQTAFVDIGQERAGFLHISEIDHDLAIRKISKYTQIDDYDEQKKESPQKSLNNKIKSIGEILSEGNQILVQVSKEPMYEKGAKLTTCFTLPGRFIVLMPNISRIGVSKRIENREERFRLKKIVRDNLPEGMGAIIRTTSEGKLEQDLLKDLNYLKKTWKDIEKKFAEAKPKELLYQDLDLSLQIIRDHLGNDIEEIIVDSTDIQSRLYQFIKRISPEYSHLVKLYKEKSIPIFSFYRIEDQINQAIDKKVDLKSGGSLIIETTEAMTVIDVNTGKFIGKESLEETILSTNLEAAKEIVRQLRLRNIGGLIVIDFIDMATGANKRKLFNFFEKTLKELDKFQSVVLKISEFGIVQMTRKRSGKTLSQQLMETCSTCSGLGATESLQTKCYALLQAIKEKIRSVKKVKEIILYLNPTVFEQVALHEYETIRDLESISNSKITIVSDQAIDANHYILKTK